MSITSHERPLPVRTSTRVAPTRNASTAVAPTHHAPASTAPASTPAIPAPHAPEPAVAAALALLPELADRRLPTTSRRHRITHALVSLLTLGLVAGLLVGGWTYATYEPAVAAQVETPVTTLDPADLQAYLAMAAADTAQQPIVLSYHDIRPDSDSIYTLDPSAFEAQMQMLSAAGYQSLSLEQVLAYRAGTYQPPARSVLITFDDGTAGLWQYADPILERYGLHAVTFLITSAPDRNSPYYLSWAEIARMQESGRWEFGSHSHDQHTKVAVAEQSRAGSALAHPVLVDGLLESESDHDARVEEDLDRSIAAFAEHGLPVPVAFAYPFSDLGDANTNRAVAARFAISFVNVNSDTQPVPVTEDTSMVVGRAEIFAGQGDREVFDRLASIGTESSG